MPEAGLNWDLGIYSTVREAEREGKCYGLQSEDGETDNEQQLNEDNVSRSRKEGGKITLHNWRTSTDFGGVLAEAAVQKASGRQAKKNASRRDRSWLNVKISSCFDNEDARRISRRDQGGRNKSTATSRSIGRANLLKESAQSLAPLALNSVDCIQNSGQSISLLSLEESNDENNDCLEAGSQIALGVMSRSQSLFVASDVPRLEEKQPNHANLKSQNFLTGSANNTQNTHVDDELDVSELPRNGCGIPCYWLNHAKPRGRSLLDVVGRSLSCGLSDHVWKRSSNLPRVASQHGSLTANSSEKSFRILDSDVEALPLLIELETSRGSCDKGASSTDTDSDRLSSDLSGELGLEVITTFSAAKNVEPSLELILPGSKELVGCEDQPRSLSQKYRPRAFDELVGQNIVVQALSNAIVKGKIAPIYLFQGSRGTGKTSAARIFASALICAGMGDDRPCGFCRDCTAFASGKSLGIKEVDAASNNGIEKVIFFLKNHIYVPFYSHFKVFILDECHMLTTETWNVLLKTLEEPPVNVVFILTTTDPDRLPRTAVSRCQKFIFPKIKDSDIVRRLQKLASLERLEIEPEALDLIASKSNGSLRDAEMTLDQLSFLGCKITLSIVQELIGSVTDEKLVTLLDFALSADTGRTIQKARELVDSGIEPLALMSQLATLITDILAGSYNLMHSQKGGFFHRHALQEDELDRLRFALRIFYEAEKQLRVSSIDRATWLTAALLQLGHNCSVMVPTSTAGTSADQSPLALYGVLGNETIGYEARQICHIDEQGSQMLHLNLVSRSGLEGAGIKDSAYGMNVKSHSQASGFTAKDDNLIYVTKSEAKVHPPHKSLIHDNLFQELSISPGRGQLPEASVSHSSDYLSENKKDFVCLSPSNLEYVWNKVLEGCQSIPLRYQWHSHAKLLSIFLSKVDAVVHLEYWHPEHKFKGERSQKRIAKMFQELLGAPVEIKFSLASVPDEQTLSSNLHVPKNQLKILQGHLKNSNCIPSGVATMIKSEESFLETGCGSGATTRKIIGQRDSPKILPVITHSPGEGHGFMAEGLHITSSPCNLSALDGGEHFVQTVHASSAQEKHPKSSVIRETSTHLPASKHGNHKADAELLQHNGQSLTLETQKMQKDCRQAVHGNCHGPSYSGQGQPDDLGLAFYNYDEENGHFYPEEETLRLESRKKYGSLLCWTSLDEEKARKQRQEGKCKLEKSGILFRFMPCAKAKN